MVAATVDAMALWQQDKIEYLMSGDMNIEII